MISFKKNKNISLLFLFILFLFSCSKENNSEIKKDIIKNEEATIKMVSVFPTSLTLLGENSKVLVKKIDKVSGGSLKIKLFEPGALVPALQSIPAVSKGSVDAAWSASGFFAGNDSVFNIFTTVPFGPDAAEFLAWIYFGGGNKLLDEMYLPYDIKALPCGVQPPEASGWFREEIKSLDDLRGLKMRFFGLGAKVMERLGVATQLLAPGDIFQALQLGTIDAAEFANPSVDYKSAFFQVAKYYYFPGWHQPASILMVFINKKKWDSLIPMHKSIIETTCGDMVQRMLAEAEATQWKAMKEMRDKHDVKLMKWPPEIMKALKTEWLAVVEEESKKNPNFMKVYNSLTEFRENYAIWKDFGFVD